MDRERLIQFILERYGADPEHPWMQYPNYAVFRHRGNRKWFAVIMDIPENKLGLSGSGTLDILNVKCDPMLIGSLLMERGFFPAYHMSKTNWISIAIDGGVEDETIKWLLEQSYELTDTKKSVRADRD